jgi:hypothetical protein
MTFTVSAGVWSQERFKHEYQQFLGEVEAETLEEAMSKASSTWDQRPIEVKVKEIEQ